MRLPCSLCGSTDFPKPIRKKDKGFSRSTSCILCHREKFNDRYELVKNDPMKYKNILDSNKRWMKRNKEHFAEYQKEWERRNSEDIRLRKHEYYLKNKKKILAKNKAWKDENRKPKRTGNKNHVWRVYEKERIERSVAKATERNREAKRIQLLNKNEIYQ